MKKNKTLQRFLAFLLSAAVLVTYMPSSVYALNDEGEDTPEVEVTANNDDSGSDVKEEPSKKAAPEAAPAPKADPPANDTEQKVEVVKEEQKEQEVTENPSGTDPPAAEGKKAEDSKDPANQDEEAKAVIPEADGGNADVSTDSANQDEEAKAVIPEADGGNADVSTDSANQVEGTESVIPEANEEKAITEEAKAEDKDDEVDEITVYFDPTIDDQLTPKEVKVKKGEAIGSNLPTVPTVPGYRTKWVMKDSPSTEVDENTVVERSFTAVVDMKKITYTVTFVQEDGTSETRVASIDNGFAINDLPEVNPVKNKVGKWVYQETGREFTVGTVISEDLTVVASYVQNIFTVTYMVDGAVYDELTTATGTKIVLPSDPVKSGATFKGWFTKEDGQGTQYTAESTVDKDMTLYAYFENQVRVHFLVKDDNGDVISEKSQYFIDLEAGDQITNMPEDPFIEGKVFDHWENSKNGDTVTDGYTVTESFDAVAVFNGINTYELTVKYFYKNDAGGRVDIGSQVFDIVKKDLPYTVTAPEYTIAAEVTDEPTYYPSQPTITVNADSFTFDEESGKYVCAVEDEYVAASAEYKVGHYLKKLSGEGYELIESVDKVGVKNSKVTPEINSYSYAEFEDRDKNVELTGDADQELKVYYTRKDFTLSFNVAGGDYIEAQTVPYGTNVALPTDATRHGYTFAGWYKDAECTQSAGTSYELKENTTLYAKWTPAQSSYKIVYMTENANDDGYSYLATVNKQAATDSSITMTAQTAGANGTRPSELDTTNFTFKDSTTETVAADGTTVVTVRYSRNVYTLQSNTSGYTASVKAKYGADITQAWTAQFNRYSGSWSYNNQNNSKFKSLTIMPSLSVRTNNNPANTIYVYHHNDTANYHQHLEYWLQNYADGDATTTYNGKTYGRVKSIDMQYNYLSNVDDWYEITGYTKAGYTAEHRRYENTGTWSSFTYTWGRQFSQYGNQYSYTRFNFYYDAKNYPLTFYNYDGTLISTQDVTLGSDISGYLTSEKPDTPMEGAKWLGWYTDQAHTSAYSGGTKMPAGLVLYGAFEFPTRTVTFDSQGGSTVEAQTDEYGFYAKTPADPVRANYIFQGWFTAADETGSPYDWNQPVKEDITLYARWTQKTISYTVHYYQDGTTTSVLPDKTVSDPAFAEGTEVTENAPVVAGYVAQTASITKALSFNDDDNVITFYYVNTPKEITYQVKYVLRDTPRIMVAKTKEVTVPGSTTNVLEMAVEADKAFMATQTSDPDILGMHYKPTEESKELQLAMEGNVITFEYVPFNTAKITVNYLDMDGNQIPGVGSETSYVEKGDTFTLQNKAPEGYVYHHAYLDGTTTAPEPVHQVTGNEKLVINVYYQKKLIIIANNKSKIYDGKALKSSGLTDATITGNMRGDSVTSIEFDGSQTEAGTSATTPMNAQISMGAQAISDPEVYYSIIYVPGSLTVKPVSVYISIAADQWNTHSGGTGPNYYTGQEFKVGFTNPAKQHFNDGEGTAYVSITSSQRDLFKAKYGDAIWNALAGNDGALITAKDAGTYTVSGEEQRAKVAAIKVGGTDMMKDPNYSVTLFARDSFLTITPLPLTITTGSDSKKYDGSALTKNDGTLDHSYWTANIGGTWTEAETAKPGNVTLGTGDEIKFEVTGKQTEVGSSENTYSIDWGKAKSSNYTITETFGTLTVTESDADVVLTAASASKTYDGTALEDHTVTASGLPEGFTVEATASGSQTDAGKGANVVNDGYVIKDASGADRTASFKNVTKVDGKLTVTPKAVTVTTGTDTKEYDGTALTKDEAAITGLIEADKEVVVVEATGSQTEVGSSENTYSIDWGSVKSSNYTVTDALGTLTVTPNASAVTLTAASASKTYDGAPLEDHTVTASGLPEGFTVEATASGSQTDAGESKNVVNDGYVIKNASGADMTANFTNVTKADGKLTVLKRKVTLTSGDGEKVYDGTALTNKNVEVTGDGFATGEGAEYDVTGSQTEVGSSENAFTYTLNEGTKADNYEITKAEGTLKVTQLTDKITVTITENSGSVKYDGTEKTVEGYTVKSSNTLYTEADFSFTGNKVVKGTNAGTYEMNLKPEDFHNINRNFSNVEFVIVDGTLEISKRAVTLTSATDTKEYDGTALTNDEITVSGDGFATGEGAAYDVTGTQTLVGISSNTFTYTLNEGTNADNYDITTSEGTLTVTNRGTKYEITVKANSAVATYDGDYHSAEGVETLTFVVDGNTYTVSGLTTEDPKQKDAGTYTNNITGTPVVRDAARNNVSSEFSVNTVNGQLVINKRTVILTSADGKKVYDGTPLTKNEQSDIAVTGDGFVERILGADEGATYVITGSQTLVGSSENAFTYTLKDNTLEKNYEIRTVFGTLTVTDGTPDEPVDDNLVVTKTADNKTYALGETVTFTIVATNIYEDEREITLKEIAGVELEKSRAAVAGGGTFTTTATYRITEADILKGSFTNTVTATVDKLTKKATATVETEGLDTTLTVNKKISNQPADGKAYKFGETIEYTIEVKNEGNVTYKNVKVEDKDTGFSETIASLAVGETKNFVTSHVVNEADVMAGSYTNTVTAKGDPIPDPKDPENPKTPEDEDSVTTGDKDDPDGPNPPIEDLDTTLTVNKKISNKPADGKAYKLGETIEYTITVKNDGNATYKNVKVEDKNTGLSETIASLAVGETKTFRTSHIVNEADVMAGSYTNTVTAKGDPIPDPKDPENPKTPEGEDSVTTGDKDDPDGPNPPVDPKNGHLTLKKETTSKAARADGKYVLNETIEYKITATNDGNLTLTDVKVKDELTNEEWTVASLAPGASREFTTRYVVKEADILAGEVVNVATATVKSPDDDKPNPPVDPGVDPEPTDGPKPGIKVNKTANRTSGLREGDTIRYTITIENTGNVTVSGIKVKDSLVNFRGNTGTIDSLAPGAKATIRYNYTVTAADVRRGRVYNAATATGTTPDGSTPDSEDSITVRTRPTPDDDDNTPVVGNPGGGNPGGPGITPAAPDDGDATVIPEEPVPEVEPEVDIVEPEVPLAAGAWALVNLISAIVTALGAAVALFRKKEDDDEEEGDQEGEKKAKDEEEEEEDDNRGKKMLAAKIAGAVAGVAAPITFILTEDMSLPMQMIDKWTLLMLIMLAAQIVAAVLNKKASKLDDDEEEENAEAAAN